jgi:hypothetical protein
MSLISTHLDYLSQGLVLRRRSGMLAFFCECCCICVSVCSVVYNDFGVYAPADEQFYLIY